MVNTRQDRAGYDRASYPPDSRILTDANALYDAWIKAKKSSDWKPKVQLFEMNWLRNISKLQKELESKEFRPSKPSEFIIRERGKERVIHGGQVRDRVVEHVLNDEIIVPSIRPYLIYDNGASLKNRGVDFTRQELMKDLVHYYNHHGNQGYILLMDYSKYYDNIRHDVLMKEFRQYIQDDTTLQLIQLFVQSFEVDVSYLSDDDYARCLDVLFNSLEYQKIDKRLLTGEKFMAKHLDIGNQTSQSAGILYPSPIDNYVKIVRGEKYYARYMDDSYTIHESRDHLQELQKDMTEKAAQIGITINQRKTHIEKLSDYWRFMQIQYSLTDNGRVIRKINPKQITRMRRKMKKMAPRMQLGEYHDWFYAWMKSHRKLMSRKQFENMMALYRELLPQTMKGETYVYNDLSGWYTD